MGIPAAAVVDIDVIKGNDLRDLLRECFVPLELIQSLGQLRGNIESHFRAENLDMKKGGISFLSGEPQESCGSLLDQLAAYGVFVVPLGAVESWLAYLRIQSSKNNWLPAIFERMRADPLDDQYVAPQENDVWAFLERISSWIVAEDRRGMQRHTVAS